MLLVEMLDGLDLLYFAEDTENRLIKRTVR